MAREGQGYPCYQHDMMMMMMTPKIWSSNTSVSVTKLAIKENLYNPVISHSDDMYSLSKL